VKKMPTIFERDWDGDRSRVLDRPNPAADWVFAGEGTATRKLDGTCCLVEGGTLWKRHEVRAGKPVPDGFREADHDETTGKRVGWLPVGAGPEDRWHREAFEPVASALADGTYELIGPKVQGNPERRQAHVLERHGGIVLLDVPRDHAGLADYLERHDIEGIVWHHPDGRMAKVKSRDFGIKR
jgi:hypothetical protein